MFDNLTTAGEPIAVFELISSAFSGLDGDYLPITTILQEKKDLSWPEVQSSLLSFEAKLNQIQAMNGLNSLNMNTSNQVNSVEVKQGGTHNWNKNNVKFPNGNGGRNFNNGNRGRGRGGRRGGFRFPNNNRPQCQICSRVGHTADVCYYRAYMNYMGTQGSNIATQGNQFANSYSQGLHQSQAHRGGFNGSHSAHFISS
ncbi:hypothetical protein Scep_012520 [Stephania cephalantha]|uniref:Uncharacterized protein n=1 Tax=Stephania cephalantha TaxID=152367 RepID=A0AAP0JHG8_9MAGN